MKCKRIIFLVILFLLFKDSVAQISLHRTIKHENLFGMSGLNGGVIMGNEEGEYYTYFYEWNYQNISKRGYHIAKFNACDELIWSKKLPFKYINRINYVKNSLVFSGSYFDTLNNSTNSRMVKMNSKGEIEKTYSFKDDWGDNLYIFDIRSDDQFHYVLGSIKYSQGNPYRDSIGNASNGYGHIVTKLDHNMNLIWSRMLAVGFGNKSVISLLSDGGVILYNQYSTKSICISKDGNLKWANARKKSEWRSISADPIDVDDGIVFCAAIEYTINHFTNEKAHYIYKLNYDGELIWTSQKFKGAGPTQSMFYDRNNKEIIVVSCDTADTVATSRQIIYRFDEFGLLKDQFDQNFQLLKSAWIKGITTNGEQYFLTGNESESSYPYQETSMYIQKTLEFDSLVNCNYTKSVNRKPRYSVDLENFNPLNFQVELVVDEVDNFSVSESQLEIIDKCVFENRIKIDLGPDTIICPNDSIIIKLDKQYPFTLWSTGEEAKEITVSRAGSYWVKAGYSCNSQSDTIVIESYTAPDIKYNISPKSGLPIIPFTFTSLTNGIDSVYWLIDNEFLIRDSSFQHFFNSNGDHAIQYIVKDSNECLYYVNDNILIEHTVIYLPNSFTPNGDNMNDTFGPIGFGIATYSMSIFNQWGELIFDRANQNWDGGKAPEGIYSYIIETIDDFGEPERVMGTFLLYK